MNELSTALKNANGLLAQAKREVRELEKLFKNASVLVQVGNFHVEGVGVFSYHPGTDFECIFHAPSQVELHALPYGLIAASLAAFPAWVAEVTRSLEVTISDAKKTSQELMKQSTKLKGLLR